MSGYFTLGEAKERPGVYHRYVNTGSVTEGAEEKVAAAVITTNWGPYNTPVRVSNEEELGVMFGDGTGVDIVKEILAGGASEVVVVRAGDATDTPPTAILKDSYGVAGHDLVKFTAKYAGNRSLSFSVKSALGYQGYKTITIYSGTKVLESRTCMATAEAIAAAFADSAYVTCENLTIVTDPETQDLIVYSDIADVSMKAFSGGVVHSPLTVNDYSDAFSALEGEPWDYVCTDSEAAAVHAVLAAFVDRIHLAGAYGRAVIGEPHTVALATRMANAAAYNDEKVIYVLNSWVGTDGTVYEGARAAARVCGMCAATPSSESLTHVAIKRAARLSESLTSTQIVAALKSGCLLFSMSSSRQVVIEKAINTLVVPAENQDDGWKKIKRTDVRFELMKRIDRIVDKMIGRVDNDTDGRAAIIAAAQRVVSSMVGEHKLIRGTVALDTSRAPEGDSAWFVIAVDDTDSLERIYLTYRFRFSENS